MNDEIGLMNYRKLVYFFENKIIVHFKKNNDIWYNGEIINLDEQNLSMMIKERVLGNKPILLEEIKTDSIEEFKEAGL